MLGILKQIDDSIAAGVAYGLGLHVPQHPDRPLNKSIPADGDPTEYDSIFVESTLKSSDALSMANTIKDTIVSRKVAILAADGVDEESLVTVKSTLEAAGAIVEVIAPRLGFIIAENDTKIPVDQSFLTAASVLFDAVYVPGGLNSVASVEADADAVHFLNEAFKHCKAIAAHEQATQVLEATYFSKKLPEEYTDEIVLREGVVVGNNSSN
jgi:catalase